MSSKYVVPHFLESPTKEKLKEQYVVFLGFNGREKRKVGMTIEPEKRYAKTSQYHQLTEKHYFATFSSFEAAVEAEKIMIKTLKEEGDYHMHKDTGIGHRSEKKDLFFLYLVGTKSDDAMCPICESTWLTHQNERQAHLESKHPTYLMDYKGFMAHFTATGDHESAAEVKALLDWPITGI